MSKSDFFYTGLKFIDVLAKSMFLLVGSFLSVIFDVIPRLRVVDGSSKKSSRLSPPFFCKDDELFLVKLVSFFLGLESRFKSYSNSSKSSFFLRGLLSTGCGDLSVFLVNFLFITKKVLHRP